MIDVVDDDDSMAGKASAWIRYATDRAAIFSCVAYTWLLSRHGILGYDFISESELIIVDPPFSPDNVPATPQGRFQLVPT